MKAIQVVFYTKENCPLCEQAQAALQAIDKEIPLNIKVVDIYKDDALLEEYQIRIPVVEISGKVIAEGIVTETELRGSLQPEENK